LVGIHKNLPEIDQNKQLHFESEIFMEKTYLHAKNIDKEYPKLYINHLKKNEYQTVFDNIMKK